MNLLYSLSLTLALGWLSYELIFRRSPYAFLDLCIVFLFGMGISAQLTFYQIFFWNKFDPNILIIIHCLLISILLLVRIFIIKPSALATPRANVAYFPFIL